MISHQSTSALYQWVAYFFQSEIPTQMYFKLVYNCICNLLHVHSKWLICVQSIEVNNQKKSKTILYISFKIFCYVSERQNIFSFYSKLAYITYQKGRHKHLKSLGREGNILLFLLSSLWQSTIQSYLLFASLRQRNRVSMLQLSNCGISNFWMLHGFEFVGVCTSANTDILYFQGTLLGCRAFV